MRPVNPVERVPWGSSFAAYDYPSQKERRARKQQAALSYIKPIARKSITLTYALQFITAVDHPLPPLFVF